MFARQIKSAGISLCQKLFILCSISSHARLYGLFYFTLSHHNHPEMWEEHFLKKYKKLHQGGLFLFFGLGIGKLNYNIFLFFWKNVRNFLRVIFFFFFGLRAGKCVRWHLYSLFMLSNFKKMFAHNTVDLYQNTTARVTGFF